MNPTSPSSHQSRTLSSLTADDVESYLSNLGFSDIEIRQDQFGKQRFLKAKKI